MGSSIEKVGSPENVSNVNPMTSQSYGMLGDLANMSIGDFVAGLQGVTPGVQAISSDITAPYAGERTALASEMARQAQRQTANQFANMGVGGTTSGGFVGAMTQAAMQPYMAATTDIAQMGTGISTNMLNQMLGSQIAGQQAGIQGTAAYGAPEWWQPTYLQKESPFQALPGFFGGLLGGVGNLLTGIGNMK